MEVVPYVGGAAGGIAALGLIIRILLRSLETEIAGLRAELVGEREARRSDVATLTEKLLRVEGLYDESRRDKHRINNELTKAQVLLGVILDLADKCSCHALDIVQDLLRRTVPPIGPPRDQGAP